ncbi:helix-turn-helix transcriptional regulator [Hamadaea sp. NPDC051192]|uniref:helix-turn-helix domain-containing protein n=1 Tax=Hamadaea sp. NPDC051192 TaxID=3154940 RepID=UPI0034387375
MDDNDPLPPTFGPRLRLLRTRAGLSLGRLAKLANYSKGHLSNIEAGAKQPSVDLARRLEAALGLHGVLSELVPTVARDAPPGAAHGPSLTDEWSLRLPPDGQLVFRSHDPADPDADAATWSIAAPRNASLPASLPVLTHLLADVRRMGQVLPPSAMLQIVIPSANSLRTMAMAASGRARDEAFRLAARFVEYAGWMAQEAGDERAATWWTDQAGLLAEFGGDQDMADYALVRKAEIALYRDNFTDAIQLARRAQAARSSRVRELGAQREAQGYALQGDEYATLTALDRASRLAGTPTGDGPPLGSTTPGSLSFVRAWSFHELGRSLEAATILTGEYARLAPESQRLRARYGARLALSFAGADHLDQACEVAEPAITTTAAIDSATARSDLRHLYRTLLRKRNLPCVRRIMPAFGETLRDNRPHDPVRPRSGRRA